MGQRLLLVDSDRRFIKDHQVALESAFDVEYLNATEGVISRLENGDYAAVLICVEVSENKGYALCSAIRKSAKLAHLKVILISAKATEEEYARHRSLKGKADLYLHKPIVSTALVAALTPLVPSRAMDPDNPLGDLSGADLGDEWLESLKTELDTEEKPKAAPPVSTVPVPVVAQQSAMVKTGPAAPSMATVAIQVPPKVQNAGLSPDAGKIALLEARVKDLEYKLQLASETAAGKDKELEEVEGDHQRLRVTVEDLGRQLTEKEQEIADLQKSKNDQEWKIGELQAEVEKTRQLADLRTAELQGQKEAASSGERQISELRQELERKEGEKKELLAQIDAKNAEAEAARVDVTGLEATLRAQRRELAEQESRLSALGKDLEGLKNADARLKELQAQVAEGEKSLADKSREFEQLSTQHEKQQLELLQALDEKEGTIGRLNATLESQRERITSLEREKQDLDGVLNERSARLEALTGAITDLENNIRRASDLTRPV